MYSDRNLNQKARDRLGKLAQTKSVAAYAAEFQEVVMHLDLENDSLMSMFYKGLNTDVKKALIYFPEAKTFDELVDQCVSIDQRLFALRKELKVTERSSVPHPKQPSNGDSSKPPGNPKKPSYLSNPGNRPDPKSGNRPGPYDRSRNSGYSHDEAQPSPMPSSSRPRGPISEEERTRRRENNLCYRCGAPDHIKDDCPLNKKAASSNVYAARPPSTPAPEYAFPSPQENWLSQDATRPAS